MNRTEIFEIQRRLPRNKYKRMGLALVGHDGPPNLETCEQIFSEMVHGVLEQFHAFPQVNSS